MKYIYLMNYKVVGSDTEHPKELLTVGASENLFNALKYDYTERYERWKSSLTELACDKSELDKILDGYIPTKTLDITSVTIIKDECNKDYHYCKSHGKCTLRECGSTKKVYFKEVEIESVEAIQFMNWVIKNEYFFNGKYWYKDFVKDKLTVEELYEIFKTTLKK
jgi:hypothetical protein